MVILSLSDAENANRRVCCEERAPDWNRNHDSRCNRVEWKREGRSDLLPVLSVLHRFCRVGHGREMELDTGTFQAINELKLSSNRKVLKVELSSVSVPKYHWNCRN